MQFRLAKHTNDLKHISQFYQDILGLQLLGSFTDHNGYDGVFLGIEGQSWHLEFTCCPAGEPIHRINDEDDLIVFYPSTKQAFKRICTALANHAIKLEIPKNPYWRENGICFFDPDGNGIIVSEQRTS